MIEERINKINDVLRIYFEQNPTVDVIPAKDLMPEFIEAGIYDKDHRNGLPIRNDLRQLDESKELGCIPFVHVERGRINRKWFFIPSGANIEELRKKTTKPLNRKTSSENSRKSGKKKKSDENYILDLCDKVLGRKGLRQYRFDFLLGDLHRDGITRTILPCDIYYPELNLVIEYNERQHTESVKHFDKPDKNTISGVHRGEQRRRYDERRRKVLPEHGIKVVNFSYFDFSHSGNRRLLRNKADDIEIVRSTLIENGINVKVRE